SITRNEPFPTPANPIAAPLLAPLDLLLPLAQDTRRRQGSRAALRRGGRGNQTLLSSRGKPTRELHPA
uniref:Uncharacterized protein n=1 Tax=Aegilops tauschii subsp. strangulata TaxID=200361 RepID=A0A453NN48_AEGTS